MREASKVTLRFLAWATVVDGTPSSKAGHLGRRVGHQVHC